MKTKEKKPELKKQPVKEKKNKEAKGKGEGKGDRLKAPG